MLITAPIVRPRKRLTVSPKHRHQLYSKKISMLKSLVLKEEKSLRLP